MITEPKVALKAVWDMRSWQRREIPDDELQGLRCSFPSPCAKDGVSLLLELPHSRPMSGDPPRSARWIPSLRRIANAAAVAWQSRPADAQPRARCCCRTTGGGAVSVYVGQLRHAVAFAARLLHSILRPSKSFIPLHMHHGTDESITCVTKQIHVANALAQQHLVAVSDFYCIFCFCALLQHRSSPFWQQPHLTHHSSTPTR